MKEKADKQFNLTYSSECGGAGNAIMFDIKIPSLSESKYEHKTC